jgi:AcrR family transcriptional regulator
VGESGTRAAILEAARRRFAEHGYQGATIRSIAAEAGVDPALVHHFFQSKERLFVIAMRFPIVPSELLSGLSDVDRDQLGPALVRAVLEVWERPETRSQSLALIRSALTNERAATMLRGFVTGAILDAVAGFTAAGDAEYRASLVGSQIVGLAVARYMVGLEAIVDAARDDLVAAVGATVQRYLTGPVRAPAS